MIVGLTGGIGTGKTTVCGIFKHLGVPVISADEIAHHIVETDKAVFQAIVHRFGHNVTTDKKINRAILRELVFQNLDDKLWLEQLLHPMIGAEIIRRAKETTYPYCVVEIPLLIEANMQNLVDRILTIDCPADKQLQHATQRGKHNLQQIQIFIANQLTREERLSATDDIIENNGDMAQLIKRVEQLHQLYLSLST